MATWIAFLRAINLGATRKFPKAGIVAAVKKIGGTSIQTHLNTGNVRFEHEVADRAEMERILEDSFAAEAGFDVPTVCLTPEELRAVADFADTLDAAGLHYVSFLKEEPTEDGVEALLARADDTHLVHIDGRGVHLVLTESDYHRSRLTNAHVEKHLGVATNRNVNVVRALAEKWT